MVKCLNPGGVSYTDFFICVCLGHTVVSVSCSPVATCWERVDCLAFLYMTFSCVFVTFLFGVLGQVWNLPI